MQKTIVELTKTKSMTEQQAEKIEIQLTEKLKIKHPDIKTHVDIINGTNEINISFFWNRISVEKWNDAKSFRMNSEEYNNKLTTEIIPYFD